jgi:hypothetical protein
MKVSKGFLILFFIWTITNQIVHTQPFIYQEKNDKYVKGEPGHARNFDIIDLTNGKISSEVFDEMHLEDNTGTYMVERNDFIHTGITNLLSHDWCSLDYMVDQVVYSKLNNKIFITGSTRENELLSVRNSASLCKKDTEMIADNIPFGPEMILSKDETKLYFPYSNENNVARFDTIRLTTISTSDYEIIKSGEVQNWGYPNAYRYDLLWGRNGNVLIKSTIRENDKYVGSYYNVYDLDNNISTPFIFSQEIVTPYFTNDGQYLILAQQRDSDYIFPETHYTQRFPTGKFMIYDMPSQKLVKILNLPPKREIYTFDNYPDNIYYFDEKSEKAITIKIDSLVNTTSGPTDSPKVIMYNLGSTVFTVDFVKGKIKYELGNGYTYIKIQSSTPDKIIYNEYDENKNLLGVFIFEKGYIKGSYTKNRSNKVLHFARIDSDNF